MITFSGLLHFVYVAFGLVSIKGLVSQRYICMNGSGKLRGLVSRYFYPHFA